MRPIDADVLLEELKLSSNMHAENSREFSLLHKDIVIVNEQPTVEAVPVSFIFDKMSAINAEYVNILRLIGTEPETVDRRIGIAMNLLREYNTLRNLIQEWKGNENE